jgi:hypothetical protein
MMTVKGIDMWEDFNDFELAEIAAQYHFQDELEFTSDFKLLNRPRIEQLLTDYEFSMAFYSVDQKSEVVYN